MTAKYQQIARDIQEKIVIQHYPPGSMIPSEAKLQEVYQVSRHTIRQAISLLISDGYLRSEKGSGTYVLDRKQTPPTTRTKTIGVITTYLSDYIFPSIIRGIEDTLRQNGYSLLLSSTNNDIIQEEICIKNMMDQGVDGLIVEPTKSNQYNPNVSYYSMLQENNTPILFLNSTYDLLDTPYASLDDVEAGYMATTHMLQKGHTNIGLIVKMDDAQGKLRMKGYIKAHEKVKRSFDASQIIPFTTQNKLEVIEHVVARIDQISQAPRAYVCYNDEIATLLIQKLAQKGIRVPEDISVVGHDNSYLSIASNVTTIAHPQEKLGQLVATQMIDTIEKNKPLHTTLYPATLIERDSVKQLV